jgi:MoxR-like ATPase
MARIVRVHHPDIEQALLDQCLQTFYGLREVPRLRKRPSTSELVDWISALRRAGVDPSRLTNEIPMLGALLKKEQDVELIGEHTRRRRGA